MRPAQRKALPAKPSRRRGWASGLPIALAILLGAVAGCMQTGAFAVQPGPDPGTPGNEASEARTLVPPSTINAWLDRGRKDDAGRPVVILAVYHDDLQGGKDAYAEVGHVPGAFKAALVDAANLEDPAPGHLSQTRSDGLIKVYGLVVDGSHADAFARRFGLEGGTTVVLTGESMIASARAYWALRYWGFPRGQLRVMDGTIEAWRAAGHPIEKTAPPFPAPSTFTFKGLEHQTALRAPISEVFAHLGDREVTLLDGRTPKEFAGFATTGGGSHNSAIGGHIRGAVNLPYTDLLNDAASGYTVKPLGSLTEVLRAKGVDPERDRDRRIFVNCRTGVRASALFLVLTEVLGFRNVAVYDGSWEEWGQLSSNFSFPPGDPLNHLGGATKFATDIESRTEALTFNASASAVLVPAVGGPVQWFPAMLVDPGVSVPDKVSAGDAAY